MKRLWDRVRAQLAKIGIGDIKSLGLATAAREAKAAKRPRKDPEQEERSRALNAARASLKETVRALDDLGLAPKQLMFGNDRLELEVTCQYGAVLVPTRLTILYGYSHSKAWAALFPMAHENSTEDERRVRRGLERHLGPTTDYTPKEFGVTLVSWATRVQPR